MSCKKVITTSETVHKSYNESAKNIDESFSIAFQNSEPFDTFLNRFVSDSTFMFSRIDFPIDGFNSDFSQKGKSYKWYKKDWIFYAEEDMRFKKRKNVITEVMEQDSSIIWRLYKKNSGYDIKYMFKPNSKGKWMLVYYQHQNL